MSSTIINLSIPDELLELVDRYAKDLLTTRSEVIRSSVVERVRRKQRQETIKQKQMLSELSDIFEQMGAAKVTDQDIDNYVLAERRKVSAWRQK
jgi:metal-responsive CopG/Arc/MetJ family transcriptional regulator